MPGRTKEEAPSAEQLSVAAYVRDAWGQAIVTASDATEDVQRIVGRLADWAGFVPDESRRLVSELTERLRADRAQLESTLESAIRRAVAPFRLPPRGEVLAVETRLRELEARLDRLIAARRASSDKGES